MVSPVTTQYVQLEEMQKLIVANSDGKSYAVYHDENGDGVVDGYKEVRDGETIKFLRGESAKSYTDAFASKRAEVVGGQLAKISVAALKAKESNTAQCVGFDDMKQVHFTGEDGTKYSLYAKKEGEGWKISAIKVNNADGSQPLIVLPEKSKVIATEVQEAMKTLESLCG